MPTTKDIKEGYKKILLPTDFSKISSSALELCAQLLQGTKAELHVLHVVDDNIHPAYYVGGKTSIFDLLPDLRRRSRNALKKFISSLPDSVPRHLRVSEGKIDKEVVSYSEEKDIDLIVMGTRGLSDIEQFFVGKVAERVIRQAICPVITVK
jgi:nucleotide-binding universal stress UspA family protein